MFLVIWISLCILAFCFFLHIHMPKSLQENCNSVKKQQQQQNTIQNQSKQKPLWNLQLPRSIFWLPPAYLTLTEQSHSFNPLDIWVITTPSSPASSEGAPSTLSYLGGLLCPHLCYFSFTLQSLTAEEFPQRNVLGTKALYKIKSKDVKIPMDILASKALGGVPGLLSPLLALSLVFLPTHSLSWVCVRTSTHFQNQPRNAGSLHTPQDVTSDRPTATSSCLGRKSPNITSTCFCPALQLCGT